MDVTDPKIPSIGRGIPQSLRRYGNPVTLRGRESALLTNGRFILAEAVAKAKLKEAEAACTLCADVFTTADSFDQRSPSR